MGRYFLRRVLQFVPVFFGATFLIFALVFLLPGDPIRALSGEKPMPQAVQDVLNERYNLNDPLPIQYGKYLGVLSDAPLAGDECEGWGGSETCFYGLLQGNFGRNFRNRPVSEIITQRIPITVRLAVTAFIFEVIIGLLAGVMAGLRKGSFIDNLVLLSTIIVISIPIFVLGYVAQIVVGVQLGWLPIAGVRNGGLSYVLPGMVLGAGSLAYIARLTRTSLVENLRADYVRTATAKGLTRGRVVGVHTLRNSLIPVVTFLGIDLGGLMGGAIVTETIFNMPGVGRATYEAVLQQEGTVVVGLVTFLVLVYLISNLVVDFLYAVLDPRIRYE